MNWNELALSLGTILDGECKIKEPLKKHTTWQIGGAANIFVIPANISDVQKTIKIALNNKVPLQILGNGSNVLVSDRGFKGIILKISKSFQEIAVDGDYLISEAGITLPKLLQVALENELSGLEFLAGIPGALGGAVYMNAGAYGIAIGDFIEEVTVCDEMGEVKTLPKDELSFSYRHSGFQGTNLTILKVKLKLFKGKAEDIKKKMQTLMSSRKEKQPLEYPNAGSVFVNPAGKSAGRLIEALNLKGLTVGGAQVSEKHANFIVNKNNASAKDVLSLIKLVQEKVKEKYNIDLETEIKIIE